MDFFSNEEEKYSGGSEHFEEFAIDWIIDKLNYYCNDAMDPHDICRMSGVNS